MRVQYEQAFSGKPIPKAEGQAISLAWSRSQREKREREAQVRALARRPARGESENMRFAMRAIEYRIVRGLWVLEISLPTDGPRRQRKHGLDYLPEHMDHYGTVASGGEWYSGPGAPAVPSNREIEVAKEAVKWTEYLDEMQARLLRVAAQTKRGDRERGVDWDRVLERLPELNGLELRTLQDRYDRALRWIVAELSVQRLEK